MYWVRACVILVALPFSDPPVAERRWKSMNTIITFFQSVGAQVVAYYLCKWLDSLMCKGSKH